MFTQYIIFNMKRKIDLNFLKSAAMGLAHEFETAMVNEPSVFEPLKFYCIFEYYCKVLSGGN